jgi:hypothetical protein
MMTKKPSTQQTVRDIRRATRRHVWLIHEGRSYTHFHITGVRCGSVGAVNF